MSATFHQTRRISYLTNTHKTTRRVPPQDSQTSSEAFVVGMDLARKVGFSAAQLVSKDIAREVSKGQTENYVDLNQYEATDYIVKMTRRLNQLA